MFVVPATIITHKTLANENHYLGLLLSPRILQVTKQL